MHADDGAEHVVISTPCSTLLLLVAMIGMPFCLFGEIGQQSMNAAKDNSAQPLLWKFDLHTSQWPLRLSKGEASSKD